MLKIKVFDCEDERNLTDELNNFIENISKIDKEVIDIKYSTSIAVEDEEQIYCYSALVMYDDKIVKQYKPKRYEILEKVEKEQMRYKEPKRIKELHLTAPTNYMKYMQDKINELVKVSNKYARLLEKRDVSDVEN